MSETLMAAFGEEFVETRILSESNSVQYWLRAYATHANAVPNEYVLTINGESRSAPVLKRGINIIKVNTNQFVNELKNFDLTLEESNTNASFLDYMNSLTSGLYVIMTKDVFKTSPTVDNWFKSKYSTEWKSSDFAKMFPNSAYVGVLGAGKGLILAEAFYANDGVLKEDSRAKLDTIYDNVGDVGYTGIPYRAIEDWTEYTSDTEYEFKRYPEQNVVVSKMSDYGLSPNDDVFFTCDLYASKALLDAKSTARVNIRWFKGNTLLASNVVLEIPAGRPDTWMRFQRYDRVPATADGFTIVASRYPRTSVTGAGKIRNVTLCKTSHSESLNSVTQEFGVNGIRMNAMKDGGTTYILELPNSKVDPSGIISAKEFKETSE